jgi:hypothetical protein
MQEAERLRQALKESLPEVDHAGADPDREPAFTYVPPSHAKALDPDVSVVEGIRGSGKSFWWAHLSSEPHRKFIGAAFPETRFGDQVKVEQGFGAQSTSTDAPSQEVLAELVAAGYSARAIWRAVLAHKARFGAPFPATAKWRDRVQWVRSNAEDFDELLLKADQALQTDGKTLVILFDALDRLGDEWATIRRWRKDCYRLRSMSAQRKESASKFSCALTCFRTAKSSVSRMPRSCLRARRLWYGGAPTSMPYCSNA